MYAQKLQSPHGDKISVRFLAPFLLAVATFGIAACSKTENPINPPVGQLRVANAIADANPIDAMVSSLPSGITNIAFGTGSGLKDFPDGSYRVRLTTNTNTGQVTFDANSTPIDKNHTTMVYGTGRLSKGTQAAFVVEVTQIQIPGNKSEVQFVNVASQQAAPLDIYVTAPGASLVGVLPTTTLSFQSNNQPALFAPGAYEVRVTPRGNPTTVLFDSGPVGVQFPATRTQQFALLDNTNAAIASPLFLLVLTGTGGNFQIQHGSS